MVSPTGSGAARWPVYEGNFREIIISELLKSEKLLSSFNQLNPKERDEAENSQASSAALPACNAPRFSDGLSTRK